jgi:hypothetical protein
MVSRPPHLLKTERHLEALIERQEALIRVCLHVVFVLPALYHIINQVKESIPKSLMNDSLLQCYVLLCLFKVTSDLWVLLPRLQSHVLTLMNVDSICSVFGETTMSWKSSQDARG